MYVYAKTIKLLGAKRRKTTTVWMAQFVYESIAENNRGTVRHSVLQRSVTCKKPLRTQQWKFMWGFQRRIMKSVETRCDSVLWTICRGATLNDCPVRKKSKCN